MKRLALLLLAAPTAAQEYVPAPVASGIVDIRQSGTALSLGDDNTRKVELGFAFDYYGASYSSAWVSSNGFVSFQSPDSLCCQGYELQYAQRNTIYAMWTDLISYTGNPYAKTFTYEDGTKVFISGWYGTQEYGSGAPNTFEIALSSEGWIEFHYGDVNLSYHQAAAGLTGSTSADTVQTFLGGNVNVLDGTSVRFSLEKEETFDCTRNPYDPACASQPAVVIDVTPEPQAETASEVVAATQVETVAPLSEVVVAEDVVAAEVVTEVVAEVVTAEVKPDAERLSPDQVAALAASSDSAMGQMPVVQISSPVGVLGAVDPVQLIPQPGAEQSQSSASRMAAEAVASASVTASAPSQQAASDVGAMAPGQNEAMTALATPPAGFSQYASARMPDAPFYRPRSIYVNNRLEDANMALYRMTQSNSRVYDAMVEAQYER